MEIREVDENWRVVSQRILIMPRNEPGKQMKMPEQFVVHLASAKLSHGDIPDDDCGRYAILRRLQGLEGSLIVPAALFIGTRHRFSRWA
eukprot:scaffold54323_cov24-Prasinocladus_malaysianus.AAC.1